MFFAWLKRYMPRGLYGRAALILLVPIVAVQLVVSIVFIQRHFDGVTRQMSATMISQVSFLLQQVDGAPDRTSAGASAGEIGAALGMEAVFLPDGDPRLSWMKNGRMPFYDFSGRVVSEEFFAAQLPIKYFDLVGDWRRVSMILSTAHGSMELRFGRERVSASNPHQLLVLMVATGIFMSFISIIFLRNQLRPIKRLARAAEAFGKGSVIPYSPSGALEVRLAGATFLDMRARIERQIEQRTMMLSGVSHDLRTPLTRFKLGLSMLPEGEDTADLMRDVEEMERLLDAFLDFARSEALDDPEKCDPLALVRGVVDGAQRGGGDVSLGDMAGAGQVWLRPTAIERALGNLIGNALRYGTSARVSVKISEKALRIRVEDNGPGIAKAQREEALKPFVRLDAARNQDGGSGVGLGLAITYDIARRHGGTLRLGASEELGGLAADIVLPR